MLVDVFLLAFHIGDADDAERVRAPARVENVNLVALEHNLDFHPLILEGIVAQIGLVENVRPNRCVARLFCGKRWWDLSVCQVIQIQKNYLHLEWEVQKLYMLRFVK